MARKKKEIEIKTKAEEWYGRNAHRWAYMGDKGDTFMFPNKIKPAIYKHRRTHE